MCRRSRRIEDPRPVRSRFRRAGWLTVLHCRRRYFLRGRTSSVVEMACSVDRPGFIDDPQRCFVEAHVAFSRCWLSTSRTTRSQPTSGSVTTPPAITYRASCARSELETGIRSCRSHERRASSRHPKMSRPVPDRDRRCSAAHRYELREPCRQRELGFEPNPIVAHDGQRSLHQLHPISNHL